jgi:hypothetical protein
LTQRGFGRWQYPHDEFRSQLRKRRETLPDRWRMVVPRPGRIPGRRARLVHAFRLAGFRGLAGLAAEGSRSGMTSR